MSALILILLLLALTALTVTAGRSRNGRYREASRRLWVPTFRAGSGRRKKVSGGQA